MTQTPPETEILLYQVATAGTDILTPMAIHAAPRYSVSEMQAIFVEDANFFTIVMSDNLKHLGMPETGWKVVDVEETTIQSGRPVSHSVVPLGCDVRPRRDIYRRMFSSRNGCRHSTWWLPATVTTGRPHLRPILRLLRVRQAGVN